MGFISRLYPWMIVLMLINQTSGLSFNQPKFSPCAMWNPDGITFANNNTIYKQPYGIFVNTNNSVYIGETYLYRVQMWLEGNMTPMKKFSAGLNESFSLFVTVAGDVYVDNGLNGRVDKWSENATSSELVMYVAGSCYGLFIDVTDAIYCSLRDSHKVIKKLSNDSFNTSIIAAGTGTYGSASNMLHSPRGIFVNIDLDLYVADFQNNRIQLFKSGQLNGITVVGNGSSATITLQHPSGVILDADNHLFIVDNDNHRIVGSGPYGFRCIVGCSGSHGSASNKLYNPYGLSFDSYGNMFVTDQYNQRVQKFFLATNTCVPSYNRPKFSPCASWNPNATTFANVSTVGATPLNVFVNTNNTVHVAAESLNAVQIWLEGSTTPTRSLSAGLYFPNAVFVTIIGDIYIDNGLNGRVDKWTLNVTSVVFMAHLNHSCRGLFVDINNTLYCAIWYYDQVIKKSLNDYTNTTIVAAGTGVTGSSSEELNSPNGIFVDINFDLYVADCGNNRIQLFKSGQLNGTTVAGNGANGTIPLHYPTGIVLDADGYLFIVDNGNYRVVGSGPNGFRCLVGCSGVNGSASNHFSDPRSLSFDSYGNIFVTDGGNNRIQKFLLATNSCHETTTTNVMQTTIHQTTTELKKEQTTTNAAMTSITTSNMFTTIGGNMSSSEQSTSIQKQSSTSATISSSQMPTTNQSCFLPIITLIPSTSSLSSPIQFRRNQDFYISSYLQLNCNDSLSTNIKWTIYNCTSTCSSQIQIDQTVITTLSELFIPARTLPYGIYELKLTVTMVAVPYLTSSISAYVKITPTGITVNLVHFGTSMITHGYQQNLILDPGRFSIDPDETTFNASNWNYEYYCRIYGYYNFPNIQGLYLTIDDPRIDPFNPSCLSNQSSQYINSTISPKSSVIILPNSLKLNQTYQFMVTMKSRQNSTLRAAGYLFVRIENTQTQMIAIACVISTMCISNSEFQRINPTTQVALFSICLENCSSIMNITWKIYQGLSTSLTNIQWNLYNQTIQYDNIWFFGRNTSNFTAINKLFVDNPHLIYWRFEVIYSFLTEISSSAINFILNQPPKNGSCSINPLNGTINTIFTISCLNWFDEDGIKDYSIYSYTIDRSQEIIIGFSLISDFEVRLPSGDNQLVIHIRDILDCITEFNLTSVIVESDSSSLIDSFQNSTNNQFVRLLSSGNQNIIGQILTSVSKELNKMNTESIENAISNNVPAASISISPLGSQTSQNISAVLNDSALIEYNKQLNSYANIRDYLMTFTTNLVIATSNSIKLQASSLVHLTQATNQLTRMSSMIASEKCYQLAQALYSMSMKISYEDVQFATNQIAQCTSNVLTAINGPLQQRTMILDLDHSRTNTFPQDYDTDIESEWSNPNLFADGNDFSSETIEKGRNIYYQKQIAEKILSQTTKTISLLTSILNIHLNIGQNLILNTPSIFMSLETISSGSLSNKSIQQIGNAQIYFPSNFNSNQSVSIRSIMQPLALADKSQSNTNLSTSISLSILEQNGNEISIQTNFSHPFEFHIPRDPNIIIPSMTLQNVTSLNSTPHYQLFNLHFINFTSNLSISLHLEMRPLNISLGYLLIYKFDSSPQLNSSINQTDGWSLLCPSNLNSENIYTYFIDNQRTVGHQFIIFGLRELNSTEFCFNQSNFNSSILNEPFQFSANYELRVYTSGCYYLDINNNWQSDGLIVGPLTNHYESQCFSNHLTTFAGGFLVLPSPINWNYVFANADFIKNKTIYLTVICISIIYIILIIYARYKDKKDLEKLGVTLLPDNRKNDQYFYQIIVFTGHRKDAGTMSKVHFILAGDDNETRVRTFADPHRKILQRGGIDAFIISVPKSLGLLNYIRIWHDNTGQGSSASWFLKYIIVRDLQTMEKSYFICQKWLAVEKEDGLVERLLPIANELEKQQFSYLLSKQAYHSISDGHLWFSIFSRPPSNKFTCIQRCTCCFVLLFTSMFLNILYYDQATEAKTTTNTPSLAFGSLYITSEQIGIGVIVELISFIPGLLLVQLFRRIQPRIKSQKKKKGQLIFPWWVLFIAYGLSLMITAISIFFIIARGIEFGDLKTQKWLTSLISGFFSSILFIQPIKILFLAIIVAFFIRNTDQDEEAIDDHYNENYYYSIENDVPCIYRSEIRVNRLDQNEITWARNQRLKELKMWSILKEIFSYFTFLSLLYFITYSNLNSNAFFQVNHLRKFFLNTRQINNDYTKIITINQYWNWLENNFIENIRAQKWYNDELPRNLSGFINDKSNRLIGWPIMRQLRVKLNSCRIQKSIQHYFSQCNDDYNLFNEENQSFEPGWKFNQTIQINNSSIHKAFLYQTGDQLDTYVHIGDHAIYNKGGYVYEFRGRLSDLRSNLSQLKKLNWIDSQTRAIIIQFNLYNPNSQLFISVSLLTEILSSSGLFLKSHFEPISFQSKNFMYELLKKLFLNLVFTSISQMICAIFYMIFIIYMMIVEIQSLLKLKMRYFKNFWSYIDLGIISCSWTGLAIFIWRYQESKRIGNLFEKTNGFAYINLEFAVYVNNILICLLGFCCFFSTLKLVRLCRFNNRLLYFTKTLQYAGKDLLSFGFMFSIVFMGFVLLFYLLFVSKLSSCSSLSRTTQMLFEMTLMKFDAYELTNAAAFLGPFCFSLFIFLVVFVCMSMFLTIINESFRFVRDNARRNRNEDQEVLEFMFRKFQRWIGWNKCHEMEILQERDEQMREKYYDPIEQFPDKVDQLLNALNRLYIDQLRYK